MNLPKKLVLIRHAESERNQLMNSALIEEDPTLFEKVARIPDHKISITENGRRQVKEVSKKISKVLQPDIVFHSGYRRTRETAEGILAEYDKSTFVLKEDLTIREREGGYTHTLMENEKKQHFPYLQLYWEVVGSLFARPIGGESLMDVIEQRLRPFLKDLFEKYPNQTIFLVTHGRVIQCIRFILDEMSWEEMEEFLNEEKNIPKNCSVTVYESDAEKTKMKLETWNEVWWE